MAADLPALLAIYNHYVTTTHATFDLEPRRLEQRRAWFDTFAESGRYQCFVAVKEDAPIGWACSGKFKEKAAYAGSLETSIYLAPGEGGQGVGRRLYETLFDALAGEDVHRAFAGVAVPNDASIALHRALGFEETGIFREAGFKFGRYWDVAWFARAMG
jgi:phosphinothricin acetyltransferase